MNTDYIEKRIDLNAPVARVWQALTHHIEFGTWFRVKLEGPFELGKTTCGQITYPGYEHMKWEAVVQKMDHERLFSFTWPHVTETNKDSSKVPWTLVEFHLSPTATGTLLIVRESGFDKLPPALRSEAFRMNEGGWTEQMKNIERHVAQK